MSNGIQDHLNNFYDSMDEFDNILSSIGTYGNVMGTTNKTDLSGVGYPGVSTEAIIKNPELVNVLNGSGTASTASTAADLPPIQNYPGVTAEAVKKNPEILKVLNSSGTSSTTSTTDTSAEKVMTSSGTFAREQAKEGQILQAYKDSEIAAVGAEKDNELPTGAGEGAYWERQKDIEHAAATASTTDTSTEKVMTSSGTFAREHSYLFAP